MIDSAVFAYNRANLEADADRQRRGVKACACGAEYTPGMNGRIEHRMKHGHTPSPQREDGAR